MRDGYEQKQRCPGESNCEDFEAAAGTTREEKEEAVCKGCHLFATKFGDSTEWMDELVDEIEQLHFEREAGKKLDLKLISPLVWEGLTIWKKTEANIEATYRSQVNALFEALLVKG